MRRETVLALISLALLSVFLALEPFLTFSLFGSDTGEYFRLTSALVATGHLPTGAAYLGWGTAYPDFPGIFLLAGAGSESLGLSPLSALVVIVPVVAALSVFPLFLLFRRLYAHDGIALLGAAFASVAMPRMFSIAHPAPLALGDFLCVAALWMLIESRRDVRWFLPLGVVSASLIVTHHLSSYLFVVSALGGLLLFELWRPGLWSRRFPTRELAFVAVFLTGMLTYWFYGTVSFVTTVILPGLGHSAAASFAVLEGGAIGAVIVSALLIRVRRHRFRATRPWVRLPSDRTVLRDAGIIAVLIFGGITAIVFVPIPGTTQTTTFAAVLWFSPILALGVFAAGARRTLTLSRLGPFSLTWIGAVGISAVVALALGYAGTFAAGFVSALPSGRHAEYLVIPLGLIAAVGLARVVARVGERYGRRALVAGMVGCVLLVAANAAIVYPPQADFGGFQEGLTVQDAALWSWVSVGVPPNEVVASDHRLSSMIFGFDGNPATWDSTPALFTGSSWSQAAAELLGSDAPHTLHAVDVVAVDSVMYAGVALNPSAAAPPLSGAAVAWLKNLPFVPLYENGQQVVYLVDVTYLDDG